jgi:HAMP domain-containing protein
MKFSIRFRILTGVVLVNLLGACIVMVYLHQSYSGGVAQTATVALGQSTATWTAIQTLAADELGNVKDPKSAQAYADQMKTITGDEYAILIDKKEIDPAAYAKARQAAGLPNNYDEGQTYVTMALTKEEWAKEFAFNPTPDSVAEMGKLVGVKNGACSKTCHSSVKGAGDYWGVTWSDEPGVTEAHGVTPIVVNNKPIGVLYSIQDASAQANAAKTSMYQTLAVIGITLLVATFAIGWMIDVWVFRRLRRMTESMEDISMRVAGGDFDARFEADGTSDEIGQFEDFFARFMDLVSATLKQLAG